MNATARPDDGDDSRKVVGLLGDGWWARFAGVPRRHGATLTSAALALALVAASAWSPDEQYTRYAFRGLWGGLVFVAALVIGEGAAILSFWPRARPVWRILSWIAQRVLWLLTATPAWVLIPLLVLQELVWTTGLSARLFHHVPHIQDSAAQLFHARIFALGRLTAPSPPVHDFFAAVHIIDNGRWYSQYPPGHIAALAIGVWLGRPWLVNPVAGGLTIATVYALGRELWDDRTGRLAAALALLSPFLLMMSSEYMNHASALLANALFLWLFARARRTSGLACGLGAGLSLGWLLLTRPYTAVAVALPFAVLAAVDLFRTRLRSLRWALPMLLGVGVGVGLMLLYNRATNGSPWVTGYEVAWGAKVRPGFGNAADGPPHTPIAGLWHTVRNLSALNEWLFGWPLPSLALVGALFALRCAKLYDWLLLASAASLVAAYFFYYFQDLCFGPRFLYEANAAWFVLSARGVLACWSWAGERLLHRDRVVSRTALGALLLGAFACAWGLRWPVEKTIFGSLYWGVDRSVLDGVERANIRDGVIFVSSDYSGVLSENAPLLDGPLVFARDLGPRNAELMAHFPGRQAWVEHGGVLTPLEPR